jgi:hypothetical protein
MAPIFELKNQMGYSQLLVKPRSKPVLLNCQDSRDLKNGREQK